MRSVLLGLLLWSLLPLPATAQADLDASELYYSVVPSATLYMEATTARPYLQLRLREAVYVLHTEGGWHYVRTEQGSRGYIPVDHLSNLWIRVSKSRRTLYVYEGTRLVKQIPVDLANNYFSDKEKRGSTEEPDHWRTPNGEFFVVRKNPNSRFYKAFVINYPNAEDAMRGLQQGLISTVEYQRIVNAEREYRMPPMNTALGGMIEIHGHGTGVRTTWTQGCVAIRNVHMDLLWDQIHVGTPVLIEP